jgi:hypothetical protein
MFIVLLVAAGVVTLVAIAHLSPLLLAGIELVGALVGQRLDK